MVLVLAAAGLSACGQAGPPRADWSVDELNKRSASCDHAAEASVEATEYVAEMAAWLDVVEIVTADRDGSYDRASVPSKVVVSSRSRPERTSAEVELVVHFSYWPAVDWALANDAQVWFGLADPNYWDAQGTDGIVGLVVVVLPDGRVFFPGSCQETLLYEPLKQEFGDELDQVTKGALGLLGDDLRAALRIQEQPSADRSSSCSTRRRRQRICWRR